MDWQTYQSPVGAGGWRVRLPRAPRPAALPEDATAGEALTAYLRTQRGRLADADQAVCRAEPDGAFDLRAAVRRTRAALRTYRPLVADPELVTELIDELRWFGREVSALRDAQVGRERITAELGELDDGLRRGTVRGRISRYFARADAEATSALFETLDSTRWAAARDKLDGAELAGGSEFTLGLLYGRESARAEAVRVTLPRYWRKAWQPEHLDWLDPELAATAEPR